MIHPQRLCCWWWQYGRRQEGLYSRIVNMGRVIVRPRVSNTHAVTFLPTSQVFSDQVVVFVLDTSEDFAVLQSSLHEAWARKYSSTLKNDLRYSATDAFETFPFPSTGDLLRSCGEAYFGSGAKWPRNLALV